MAATEDSSCLSLGTTETRKSSIQGRADLFHEAHPSRKRKAPNGSDSNPRPHQRARTATQEDGASPSRAGAHAFHVQYESSDCRDEPRDVAGQTGPQQARPGEKRAKTSDEVVLLRQPGVDRSASGTLQLNELAQPQQRLELHDSLLALQKSSSVVAADRVSTSRHLHHFFDNDEYHTEVLQKHFDKCVAEHNLLNANSLGGSGPHQPRPRSFLLSKLCSLVTDYRGTVDRFASMFLPALCIHRDLFRQFQPATWMSAFLVTGNAFQQRERFVTAHQEYKRDPKHFVAQLESAFTLFFAAAIDHHYNHLIADGSTCKHLLSQENCPNAIAAQTDCRAQRLGSDLEWDVERVVVYMRAATNIETHTYWTTAHDRVAHFCHELGIEPTNDDSHSCHALMVDLAKLRSAQFVQRDQQLNNRLIQELDAKDRRIKDLELQMGRLSHLQAANQSLKSQMVCVQARGLFEQLSAQTLPRDPKNDSLVSKWRGWVDDVVRHFWGMSPHEQQSHPLHPILEQGDFRRERDLATWMHGLYRDFSYEIHNIDTKLLINDSSIHKGREKILLLAMNPTSFDDNGDVDFARERQRYVQSAVTKKPQCSSSDHERHASQPRSQQQHLEASQGRERRDETWRAPQRAQSSVRDSVSGTARVRHEEPLPTQDEVFGQFLEQRQNTRKNQRHW